MAEFKNMDSTMTSMLTKGAFLTSASNTMTISWGFVGVMWGKKVFIAAVRDSRYTKEFIETTNQFTVSVPEMGTLADALKFCGSKSGRTFDKWAECGLEKLPAKVLKDTFVVGGCQYYFECKVLSKIDSSAVDISKVMGWYQTNDVHNFYFGEVVEEY